MPKVNLSEHELHQLQTAFEDTSPPEILQWAVANFGEKLAIVTSFQPTGIVTLHMLQHIAPRLTVITLDTELLFPETYNLIDEIENRFNLNLIRVKPQQTVAEQAQRFGEALWERQPNRCCHLRKVLPLRQALAPYHAWITGLRRDQSEGRSTVPIIDYDQPNDMIKLSPLATWTEDMVWAYIRSYHLPYNPLHDQGYPSIGCLPCTQAVLDGADKRSGRWVNQNKTECGIHLPLPIETPELRNA